MDIELLFGFILGLVVIPIALAAMLGEWLNGLVSSKAGSRASASNLASRAGHAIVLWRQRLADMLSLGAVDTPVDAPEEVNDVNTEWAGLMT